MSGFCGAGGADFGTGRLRSRVADPPVKQKHVRQYCIN